MHPAPKNRAAGDAQSFGSVTAKDLSEALDRQNFEMDRRKIQLYDPIKQLGEYRVPIRLHREVKRSPCGW